MKKNPPNLEVVAKKEATEPAEESEKIANLPPELKKQLSAQYLKGGPDYSQFHEKLVKLFNDHAKRELSIDDIIVAWYYKYEKEILTRNATINKISRLVEEKKLKKIQRGIFSLPKTE